MNITFGITEMQTLNDLQALAKAHKMEITFGFASDTTSDMDYDILEKNKIDSHIIDILKDEDIGCPYNRHECSMEAPCFLCIIENRLAKAEADLAELKGVNGNDR